MYAVPFFGSYLIFFVHKCFIQTEKIELGGALYTITFVLVFMSVLNLGHRKSNNMPSPSLYIGSPVPACPVCARARTHLHTLCFTTIHFGDRLPACTYEAVFHYVYFFPWDY